MKPPRQTQGRAKLVLLAFLAIAGFFLLSEHRAHVFGFLPYLFLLACPLMHVFMHGGHSREHEDEPHEGHKPGAGCGDATKQGKDEPSA